MNKRQQASLNSYRSVLGVFDRFPDQTASVPALARAATWVRERVAEIEDAVEAQADYAPQGTTKTSHRQTLAETTVPVAQALSARADEAGDPATADQFDLSLTDVLQGTEQDALDRAGSVLQAARAVPDDELADVGVTPADVDALDDAHEAFARTLPAPRDQIVVRRGHTTTIERLIPAVRTRLDKRVDKLMVRFRGTPFHDEYLAARTIVDPGSRPGPGPAM